MFARGGDPGGEYAEFDDFKRRYAAESDIWWVVVWNGVSNKGGHYDATSRG